MTPPQFRSLGELTDYLTALENRIQTLESENANLQHYITDLGGDAQKMLPKTGLLSTSFIQRAFTVWGHYFVAQLVISIPIICIYFLLIYFMLQQGEIPNIFPVSNHA